MPIINRFAILLAEKASRENRIISIAEVAREIEIDQRTLSQWAKNTITRYDVSVIMALCKYLNCKPGDLIILTDDAPTE